MSRSDYLIVPKGMKFMGSGKLGLIPLLSFADDFLRHADTSFQNSDDNFYRA